MFRLWLEWDYGQESIVFTSIEKAKQWVLDQKLVDDLEDDKFLTYQELAEEGLASIEQLTII